MLLNKEITKRLTVTAILLITMRFLGQISVPYVNTAMVRSILNNNDAFSFFNFLTGGSMEQFSLFSLNISPYITSTIIIQLLSIIFTKLEKLQKNGEYGRRKINYYTRLLSIVFSVVQSIGVALTLRHMNILPDGILPMVVVIATLIAGSNIILFIANLITTHGLGNGISLILATNMISRIPKDFYLLYTEFVKNKGFSGFVNLSLIILVVSSIVLLTIIINEAVRKIPVQYSSRLSGKIADNEFIPLKVNSGNVIPVIFVTSLISLPSVLKTITNYEPTGILGSLYYATQQQNWFILESWKLTFGYFVYMALLIYFAYYYTEIQFNPEDVADGLKRAGASIPNVRMGDETKRYIEKISKPLILIGALLLGFVVTIPMVFSSLLGINVSFGGTALIIITSVAVETAKQGKLYIEAEKML